MKIRDFRGARVIALTVCVWALSISAGKASPIALDFTAGSGFSCVGGGFCTIGWDFTVISTISVDALGVWDNGTAGIPNDHTVMLWTALGAPLASALVTNVSTPVASTGPGRWLFTTIAPVILTPGSYVIGTAYPTTGNEVFRSQAASATTIAEVVLGNARFGGGATITFPGSDPIRNPGWFGPNFQATAVPEPGSLVLLLTGGAALIRARRRG